MTRTNIQSHPKVSCDTSNKPVKPPNKPSKPQRKRVAKLIGKRCMLSCLINGVTTEMLLDSGAQVSIVGRTWIENTLPDAQIQPMASLLEEDFYATAANGTPIPFEGWTEVLLELKSIEHGNIAIHVPMLVSQSCVETPLLRFNVIEELIWENSEQPENIVKLVALLSGAMKLKKEVVNNIVSAVTTETPEERSEDCVVKMGKRGLVINIGEICEVKCRVRSWLEGGAMLFEPALTDLCPDGLELVPSVIDVPNGVTKIVRIPVQNSTQHDIYLPQRTVLGTINQIFDIKPVLDHCGPERATSERESVGLHSNQVNRERQEQQTRRSKQSPTSGEKWHPPVELDHLPAQEQEMVRQMLYEECDVFARED